MTEDDGARSVLRRDVLRALSSDEGAVAEVARYCASPFRVPRVPAPVLPQADEPHVADWRRYAQECAGRPFEYLRERLPQLAIPIREGVSSTEAYGAVTRRGQPVDAAAFGGRLELRAPATLRLLLHEHPAGALPVLTTPDREDFETLFRALACRNEPKPVSPAVNAQIVTGLINWDRVGAYREAWGAAQGPFGATGWPAEMGRVARDEKWRFQDRLLLTCERPYSSVSARDLGLPLSEAEWLERSTLLRIEHEFTHYLTKRVFDAMSLNLLDETVADFAGLTHALGRFEAAWYLRFLGLESWPEIREEGRAGTYAVALSPAAFRLLCALVVHAATALETLAVASYREAERARFVLAIASLGLDLLASAEAPALFAEAWRTAGEWVAAEA